MQASEQAFPVLKACMHSIYQAHTKSTWLRGRKASGRLGFAQRIYQRNQKHKHPAPRSRRCPIIGDCDRPSAATDTRERESGNTSGHRESRKSQLTSNAKPHQHSRKGLHIRLNTPQPNSSSVLNTLRLLRPLPNGPLQAGQPAQRLFLLPFCA